MVLQFGNLIEKPVAIIPDRLWRLNTTEGNFALKKLDPHSPAFHNAESGEAIAELFKQKRLPVIAAIMNKCRFILESENQYFLLFPWRFGKTLSSGPASYDQANIIGRLLANFHQANIEFPAAKNAIWQNFQKVNWRALLEDRKTANQLENWSDLYFKAREKLGDQKVISHGDLTQANIIWDQMEQPWAIDWETAGWIHPHVELLGVALNWSGINVNVPVPEILKAVFAGYENVNGKVHLNQTLVYASFGSWLNWLAFNLQSFASTQKIAFELETQRILTAINHLEALSKQL